MTKEELAFMQCYDIKEMVFDCLSTNTFVAHFTSNLGETFEFKASKQKVIEHIERYCREPERYMMDKWLVIAHFKRMARSWYAKTHLPKKYSKRMK